MFKLLDIEDIEEKVNEVIIEAIEDSLDFSWFGIDPVTHKVMFYETTRQPELVKYINENWMDESIPEYLDKWLHGDEHEKKQIGGYHQQNTIDAANRFRSFALAMKPLIDEIIEISDK